MVFRPYRYDGVIAYDAIQMGDAETAEALIADIFADPTIEFIHTRNVYARCYMFRIQPAPGRLDTVVLVVRGEFRGGCALAGARPVRARRSMVEANFHDHVDSAAY